MLKSYVAGAGLPDIAPLTSGEHLQTPDGSNHILYRVSAVPAAGGLLDDPPPNATGFLSTDFGGFGNPSCISQQYTRKLVFTTVDGSAIRVEAYPAPGQTPPNQWTAYFPDGTQVSGPISTAPSPTTQGLLSPVYYADDSPANKIT